MSGINFQFNVAKGQIKTLWNNVDTGVANTQIVVVPIGGVLTANPEPDEDMNNHTTLGSLLGVAATVERTTMGRKPLTTSEIELEVSNSSNYLELNLLSSITWTAATGDPVKKLLFCYDGNTLGGTDNDIIPLLAYSFDANPSGIDIIVTAHVNGLIRIT